MLPASGSTRGVAIRELNQLDVRRRRTLRALLGVERDLRSIGERAGAVGEPRLMDEQILAALVRGDEAETLLLVEPLNCAGCPAVQPPRVVLMKCRGYCPWCKTCFSTASLSPTRGTTP